MQKAI